MNHLIMGTAGHVDHGKTALIKVLTNIDCDTHPEEKKRGITINLGFSHLNLSNENSIGIVDVPGHRDFIHTMVSGASGIDFVLLVIAADSGVMPQTKEHLQIMQILGINKGLIAITKTDLVDEELLEMSRQDVCDLVKGTFLQDCKMIECSAVSLSGIENLKSAIKQVSEEAEKKQQKEIFRMFIDRIFIVQGFGTVVTGSVISGSVETEDNVYLLPSKNEKLRIRRLERHGKEVKKIIAGDRASINLVGLKKQDFKRGMILSDKLLKETNMIDVKLKMFDVSNRLELWSQVIFLSGTYEGMAKIHLIDCDEIKANGEALAQIHLDNACVFQYKDKFVIRSSSSDITLGGGEIIDPYPLHHRRRSDKLLNNISKLSSGDLKQAIASEIRKRFRILTIEDIITMFNVKEKEVFNSEDNNFSKDIVVIEQECKKFFITKEEIKRLKKRITACVLNFHKNNPLKEIGITFQELSSGCGMAGNKNGLIVLKDLLLSLEETKKIIKIGKTWVNPNFSLNVNGKMEKNIEFIETHLKSCGLQVPLMSKLISETQNKGIMEREMKQILNYLVKNKQVYSIDSNFIHKDIVNDAREKMINILKKNTNGIKVSDFRDIIGGNRKICLLLLSQFDFEGTTKREGDIRVLG